MSSEDDLPSLQDIFSRVNSAKKAKMTSEASDKENIKLDKVESTNSKAGAEPLVIDQVSLKPNTGVFVKDHYNGKYVPGIIVDVPKSRDNNHDIYSVKLYDGRIDNLGRKYILCPEDVDFYSVKVIPIESVLRSDKSLVRNLNKHTLKKIVNLKKADIIGILNGSISSERDERFRSNSHSRRTLNIENPPGPFAIEEYKFLLEYFADHFVPEIINENDKLRTQVEERFEKTGKALDHLLRQYSYTVLVPEFVARRILDLDTNIKSLSEAFDKLYNDSSSFDLETGNFINYLYSKQEMYRYARRERS